VKPIVVAGPGTYPDEVLSLLGATNAMPKGSPLWPTLSIESLLSLAPNAIVVMDGENAKKAFEQELGSLKIHPNFKNTRILAASTGVLQRPTLALAKEANEIRQILSGSAVK
jgi:ABC-type Fe3+-hydroxamate transport system substrate-binding protein